MLDVPGITLRYRNSKTEIINGVIVILTHNNGLISDETTGCKIRKYYGLSNQGDC